MPSVAFPQLPHDINVSTGTFVKAVLIVLAIWFAWYIRDVIAILFAALLLSALIEPFAAWLSKHRIPKPLAVLTVYAGLFILVGGLLTLIIPIILEQGTELIGSLGDLATLPVFQDQQRLLNTLNNAVGTLQSGITGGMSSFLSTVRGFVEGILTVFLVLVLAFYLVVEEDATRLFFRSFAPTEYQPYLIQVISKMQEKLGFWLRGQLVLAFIIFCAVYLGLSILGVPYALLLAVIAGVCEIVPYIGPIFALVPAAIVGFAQAPLLGLLVVILYIVIQQVENHFLVPQVMRKVAGLNPLICIIALMIGLKIAGPIGAILAIPCAIMLVVLLEDLFTLRHTPSV